MRILKKILLGFQNNYGKEIFYDNDDYDNNDLFNNNRNFNDIEYNYTPFGEFLVSAIF